MGAPPGASMNWLKQGPEYQEQSTGEYSPRHHLYLPPFFPKVILVLAHLQRCQAVHSGYYSVLSWTSLSGSI